MNLVLDAGALIAVDRGDRKMGALLKVAQADKVSVVTSAAVVAQVWRDGGRQARLARVLAGCDVRVLDLSAARVIGVSLGRSASADVVDGHVASMAEDGDRVVTSDPDDITVLLQARHVDARVVTI